MVFALFFVFSEGFFCVELCKRERGALSFFFFLESKKKKKKQWEKKLHFLVLARSFSFAFSRSEKKTKEKEKPKLWPLPSLPRSRHAACASLRLDRYVVSSLICSRPLFCPSERNCSSKERPFFAQGDTICSVSSIASPFIFSLSFFRSPFSLFFNDAHLTGPSQQQCRRTSCRICSCQRSRRRRQGTN